MPKMPPASCRIPLHSCLQMWWLRYRAQRYRSFYLFSLPLPDSTKIFLCLREQSDHYQLYDAAKNRVAPVAQAGSESDELKNVPNSLKESPQDNKLISSDEQKIVSAGEQPSEDAAEGSISSSIENT